MSRKKRLKGIMQNRSHNNHTPDLPAVGPIRYGRIQGTYLRQTSPHNAEWVYRLSLTAEYRVGDIVFPGTLPSGKPVALMCTNVVKTFGGGSGKLLHIDGTFRLVSAIKVRREVCDGG